MPTATATTAVPHTPESLVAEVATLAIMEEPATAGTEDVPISI
jgi:hypothetical protein